MSSKLNPEMTWTFSNVRSKLKLVRCGKCVRPACANAGGDLLHPRASTDTSLSLQTKPDLNTQKGQDEVLLRHLSLARRLCCRICSCFYLPKPRNCKSIFSFWRIRIIRRRTHINRKIGGWQPPIQPWLLMKGTPSSDEPICFIC